MKTFMLLLLLTFPTYAQESNARLAGVCGFSQNSGFENPICGIEAGGSAKRDKVVLDGSARYLFAKKIPGGGHNVGGNLALRINLGKVFVGPAIGYTRQTTSFYTKDAFAVGGEVGGWVGPVILSGRFLQDTSESKGRSYDLRGEFYGGKGRVGPYVAGLVGMSDFRCNQGPVGLTDHCTSAHGSISVGVYIR